MASRFKQVLVLKTVASDQRLEIGDKVGLLSL